MSESLPPSKVSLPAPPRRYLCQRVTRSVVISGKIDDPQWAAAEWTEDFLDILGETAPRPAFRTRAKMLWDTEHFYIAAELEEPHVWATLTEHDSVIFNDNDFEVFIDPDGDGHIYAELEINALNTTWDLLLTKPYRTRGTAINGWEIKGLRTAVFVDGTLNDPSDSDRGWSVEIAIPWAALDEISQTNLPPQAGDHIRLNFSRVQWEHEIVDGSYRKVANRSEENWVWSPQGVVDMHRPHRWGCVTFIDGEAGVPFTLSQESQTLSAVYELQRAFHSDHDRWASNVDDLGIAPIDGLSIEATTHLLEMRLGQWMIDGDSRVWELA